MGIKKRIMTSGQKFVKKHRKFMQTLGDPLLRDDDLDGAIDETGDAAEIDMPGQSPFISALEVLPLAGQVISFNALVENTAGLSNDEMIQVTLDGTALPEIAMDNRGSEASNTTVDGQKQKKGIVARPIEAVPFTTNLPGGAGAGEVYDSDWLDSDRVLLSAEATPAILSPGEHTLKVAVKSNNKVRFTKSKKFIVADSKVTFDSGHAQFVAENAADGDNLDVNIAAGAGISGTAEGDKTAWALADNKYQVTVTKGGNPVELRAGGVNGGKGVLSEDELTLVVTKGSNGTIQNLLKADDANAEHVVTITPFNKKGQLDTGSAVSVTKSTGANG